MKTLETKYQCLVCQSNKNSLGELHWHQTYKHTSEELSLAIINKKGLVKIIDPSVSQKEVHSERSILSSFSKKPSQFYYLSSTILQVGNNELKNIEAPMDCSLPSTTKLEKDNKNLIKLKKKVLFDSCLNKGIKELTKPLEFDMKENVIEDNLEVPIDCTLSIVKKEKILCDSSSSNTIGRFSKNLQLNKDKEKRRIIGKTIDPFPVVKIERIEKKDSNIKVGSSSQTDNRLLIDSNNEESKNAFTKELSITKDISMEDFVEGADELCTELEELNKIAATKKAKKRKQ